MKAARIHRQGEPEVLQLDEVPRPVAAEGQVVVRVSRAGLNFVDVYHRRGQYPLPSVPWTLGLEAAGVVEEVGREVSEARVGDRVAWNGVPGSYAEYVAVPADRLIPLSEGVDFDAGAALPLQGMTAHYLVHSLHETKPGETMLIHAAAGGVGQLATQMAKLAGARVIGTVSTEAKARLAREAGADHVILYTQQDFVEEVKRVTDGLGVDVVLDSVGKDTFAKSLQATRVRGQAIIFGSASGPADPISPNSLQNPSKTISGGSLAFFTATRQELLERANAVFGWYEQGELRLRIDRVLPLAKVAEAHRALESREAAGKVLLAVD